MSPLLVLAFLLTGFAIACYVYVLVTLIKSRPRKDQP